jgi:heparin binding hemagglutinin HbhA
MPTLLPSSEDVRKAREQAVAVLNTAAESVRTPLLAALGAGDLATQAVIDAVNKARTKVNEGPKDLTGLREKVDPAELRKLVDEYTEAAQKLYHKLADQGEDALTKLKTEPHITKAIDQVEEAIAALQDRVGDVAGDARELAEEVLAKVTRRTHDAGEKAAITVEQATEEAALAVEGTGAEVAEDVRTATRKAASKTAPRKTAPRTASTTRRTNGATKPTK